MTTMKNTKYLDYYSLAGAIFIYQNSVIGKIISQYQVSKKGKHVDTLKKQMFTEQALLTCCPP